MSKQQQKKPDSKALAVQRKAKETSLRATMGKIKGEIDAALPQKMREYMSPERMCRLAMTSIRTSQNLWKCDDVSIIAGIVLAAQHGLEIDMRGQAWLIPRYSTKRERYEANFQIGYQGLLTLARRSGVIEKIEARVVYENDSFSYQFGTDPSIEHQPTRLDDPGELAACYAIAWLRGGAQQFEVLEKRDIEKVKSTVKLTYDDGNKTDSPWNTWEEQMWRKTAAIRLAKWLPSSIDDKNEDALKKFVSLDDIEMAGKHQHLAEIVGLTEQAQESIAHEPQEGQFTGADLFGSEDPEEVTIDVQQQQHEYDEEDDNLPD